MTRTLTLLAIGAVCTLGGAANAQTIEEKVAALKQRIQANEAKIANLKSEITAEQAADAFLYPKINKALTDTYTLDNQIPPIKQNLASHESKTQYFTMDDSNLYITGANLQIWSGSNTANGKGNLIVGFNTLRGANFDHRTGSHNLVFGNGANYSSQYGIVGGYLNNSYALNGVALTGEVNTATGIGTAPLILTGFNNFAEASQAVIVSGNHNTVKSGRGVILTGSYNSIFDGYESVILNGERNTLSNSIRSVIFSGYYGRLNNSNNSILTTANNKTYSGHNTIW